MLVGITLFGAVTANLASFLVKSEDPKEAMLKELLAEVKTLKEELAREKAEA